MSVTRSPFPLFLVPLIKVAPKPATSIPKIELCAIVEATRAARKITNRLDVPLERTLFYTDSEIVLGYLTNTKKSFQRYVTARVTLVLQNSSPEDWRYIPSRDNPADKGSRPNQPFEFIKSCWAQGPEFIRNLFLDSSSCPVRHEEHLPEEIPTLRALVAIAEKTIL